MAIHNAGGRVFNHAVLVHSDVSAVVDGCAQRIHYAADHTVGHTDTGGLSGTVHRRTLADLIYTAEQDTADAILPQLLHHTPDAALKQQDLSICSTFQAVHIGNAVRHGQHTAHLAGAHLRHPVFYRITDQRDH